MLKQKAKQCRAFVLMLFLLLPLVCSCGASPFVLTVLVLTEEDCSADSNWKEVPYGSDISFSLTLPDGESVIQVLDNGVPAENVRYENGVLTLKKVKSPHTLRVVTGDPEKETFFGGETSDKRGGNLESSTAQGRITKGSYVTFRATPRDKAVFCGWSLRKPLEQGGELLSTDEQFTMAIEGNTFIYANYDTSAIPVETKPTVPAVLEKYQIKVYYNANGGTVRDGKAAIETDFDISYWQMPNARQDDGEITRDGYVLLGYSFDPDGVSGVIPPSHKFLMPEAGAKRITMYCIWQKAADETDFEVEDTGNGVTITKYTGSGGEVYIPRTIGGKNVTVIAKDSFSGTDVSFVSIPPTVTKVERRAFMNCEKLEGVTVYDTLKNVYDESFAGSPVKTMRICGATLPKYMTGQSFGKKFERLVTTIGEDRVVTVSGSSKHSGLDTAYLEELLGGEYTVVNFGTNAMMNIVFFFEAVCHYIGEKDYVVYAPEQYGPYAEATNGNPNFPSSTYQGIEDCYNLMELVDITNYSSIFNAFSEYCTTRANMKNQSYSTHNGNFDIYGQFAVPRPNLNKEDFAYGANGTFRFDETVIPEEFRGNMNRVLDLANATGATVYFSHPPMNKNNIRADHLNDEHYDAYGQFLRDTVHAEVISDVRDYILEGKYFYDTDYHPNEPGKALHTEALAKDLIAAIGIGN